MTCTVYGMRHDGHSLAIGTGTTEDGRVVRFACEPRAAHDLALAILAATDESDLPVAEVPPWAVLLDEVR